ncbi:unnamed protein product [Hermetia illucens]|uniref:Uncharacterized protein n=1 Tax=Hermetia illucens TaxID=343691 RepID=A0A7R8YY11_HERIL|nr:uncharacterized protein LOC119656013 isoform X2 [Hermetia illucens]CAD7089598.1 unnamed protein product [Hermetia illucens]
MFKPFVRILLKVLELCGCIACVITKVLTDQEARRVAIRNQKYSMEWALLTNVTWSREGSAFASITYGGFTLITSLLLIARIINSKSRPSSTEKVFLTVGMLFFIAMGGLVLASLEQVPQELHDNAIILGTLSFLVALLFLIDLADPTARYTSTFAQTEQIVHSQNSTQTQMHNQREFKELNIPNLRMDTTPIPSPDSEVVPPNGNYFSEKTRPFKRQVSEPQRLINLVDEEEDPGCAQGMTYMVNRSFRSERMQNECPSDEDNLDKPMKQGFVAHAARMWEKRTRRNREQPLELSTIV